MANPLPFEEFFDFISVGEKNSLKMALDVLKEINDLSRDEKLKRLSELDGIYVPKYPKNNIKVTRTLTNFLFSSISFSLSSFIKSSFVNYFDNLLNSLR